MTSIARPLSRGLGPLGNVLQRRALGAFLLTFACLFVLVASMAAVYAAIHRDTVFPGVTVAGVPVGGLDPAAAEARLRTQLPPLADGAVSIWIDGTEHRLAFADVNRDYDFAAMLDRALAIGRGGDPLTQFGQQLRTVIDGIELTPSVTLDEQRLADGMAAVALAATTEPRDATIVRTTDGYEVVPAAAGRAVQPSDLRQPVVGALRDLGYSGTRVEVASVAVPAQVDTTVAQAAVDRFSAVTGAPILVNGVGFPLVIGTAQVRDWTSLEPTQDGADWTLSVDSDAVAAFVAGYAAMVDRPAVEARLEMTGDGAVAVGGSTGQTLDVGETVNRIAQTVLSRDGGAGSSVASLAIAVSEPQFTSAEASALAAQVELISRWTTRYVPSESNFFGKNISIPAKLLNGTVVEPGERFSFLDAVGEISERRGFGLGGAIIRGRTQPTGAMGGGICSASTTLFNAALRGGYEIVSRTQHSYYISRYPVGLDATVFRSGSSQHDMVFVNDSASALWIRGINGRNRVTFEIWSVPDGRTVKLSKPRIDNRRPAEDIVEYVPTLKPGVEKRVDYAIDGFDSWVTRTVTDANGSLLHSDEFFSHYITITGVTEVGISPEPPPSEPAPTEPLPSEPPPSEPPSSPTP